MCLNPLKIKNRRLDFDSRFDSLYLYVPCGHCYQCIESKKRDLEIRAISEMQRIKTNHGSVWNYTLTYNDDNLPHYCGVPVLSRRDMQLFKKRLKKRLGDLGSKCQVQYCGEYGRQKDRPHWHIILYCDFEMDALEMYDNVRFAWSELFARDKGVYFFKSKGFVGLPSLWLEGKLQPFNPINALVKDTNAVKYCIKYTFKSYNFEKYLYGKFKTWLKENMDYSPSDDISTFEFPEDENFKFSDSKAHDIDYIVHYFGKCFRNPNFFGMAQESLLDDKFIMKTDFKDNKGAFLYYPISDYLKRKLFHMSCVDDGISDVICSRYTKKWLKYMLNNINDFVINTANLYICNQDLKLKYNSKFEYGKDVLNFVTHTCDSDLYSICLHRFLYLNKVNLFKMDLQTVLYSIQSRPKLCDYISSESFYLYNDKLNSVLPVLQDFYNEICYNNYVRGVQCYNERQSTVAIEYAKFKNKGKYKPKYLDTLPFDKFINLKKLSKVDVTRNF